MEIKCKCGKELQLTASENDFEIYNCDDDKCDFSMELRNLTP